MPNSHSAPLDYRRILAAAPALFLILDKDAQFTILDASDAYLRATLTRREAIVGRPLFEVFPDNPEEIGATGTRHLRASLHRVLASRGADTMAVQKYDVRRPEGGGFVERYWSPVNSPVLSPDGDILWIVHRVEDVTELVRANAALQRDGESMRIEVLLRSQELDEANRKMREANEQFRAIYNQGFFAGRLALDGTVLDVNRSSLATGMDVTERVEAERRRSTEAALVEADRHKDEFIATLSHELRSPLAPIRNALSLLRLTGRPDAKTTQVYAIMDGSSPTSCGSSTTCSSCRACAGASSSCGASRSSWEPSSRTRSRPARRSSPTPGISSWSSRFRRSRSGCTVTACASRRSSRTCSTTRRASPSGAAASPSASARATGRPRSACATPAAASHRRSRGGSSTCS